MAIQERVETHEVLAKFGKVIKEHSSRSQDDIGKLKAGIEKISSIVPDVVGEKQIKRFMEQRSKVITDTVHRFLITQITEKFPVIDDSLFALKREIVIDSTDKKNPVIVQDHTGQTADKMQKYCQRMIVPLFAYALLPSEGKCVLGKIRKYSSYGYYKTIEVTVKIPVPLNNKLLAAEAKALGTYYAILGKAFNDISVGNALMEIDTKCETGVLWIPTIDSLDIKTTIEYPKRPVDPALVLRALGRTFLIKMWTIEKEESMDYFMREFTTS